MQRKQFEYIYLLSTCQRFVQ